jgi:hypothetical protein
VMAAGETEFYLAQSVIQSRRERSTRRAAEKR